MGSLKVVIFVLTFVVWSKAFQITKVPNDVKDDGIHLYDKPINVKVNGCIIEQQLHIIPPEETPPGRLLQQTHGLRMRGYFVETSTSINTTVLRNIFIIAAYYFQKTLTVTDLSAQNSIYPSSFTDCVISTPQQFKVNGFDVTTRDMTIFVVPVYQAGQSYVAAATPCILVRWPTYGAITYNSAFISTNTSKSGEFHSNIYVSIHQIMHILALNNVFFDSYYQSFTSSSKIPTNQVTRTSGGRTYIILPSVVSYVQTFFNCNDGTGGILQDDGGSGTAGSHWQRRVYYDELMTPSLWASGLRISQLTLSLMKDTGFYASVDINMADTLEFGRGQGCAFAQSNAAATPEFCTGTANGCDFNNAYIGRCSSSDTYADGISYFLQLNDNVCIYPQNSATNPNYNWGPNSRCIMVDGSPTCYTASCGTGKIDITINGETVSCINGGSATVALSNSSTVTCPTNQTVFCAFKTCADWCGQKGICVAGTCYIADLTISISQQKLTLYLFVLLVFGLLF